LILIGNRPEGLIRTVEEKEEFNYGVFSTAGIIRRKFS
jgi:hypothetical protein